MVLLTATELCPSQVHPESVQFFKKALIPQLNIGTHPVSCAHFMVHEVHHDRCDGASMLSSPREVRFLFVTNKGFPLKQRFYISTGTASPVRYCPL
jgi:hypothetical protein